MANTPISAEDIQRATEALQLMTAQLERAGQQASAIGKKVFKDWETDAGAAVDKLHKESKTLGEHMKSAIVSPITLAIKTYKTYQGEIKKTGKMLNEGMGAGADKAGGLFTGTQKVAGDVMGKFPMAGFFGFLLYGKMTQAQYAADAQKSARIFENTGGVAAGSVRSLYGNIRALSQSIPEIAAAFDATNSAAAEMGVTSSEAMEKVNQKFRGATSQVYVMATALDTQFRVASGTSSKAAATLAQNTNASYKESIELISKMGAATKNTGISYSALLASIMQTTSALRLQGVETKSIAETIKAAQAGFGAQGMNAMRSGAISMAGVQGIAGAISGLNVGLKAVLGEGMSGGRYKGLAASRRFDMGMLQGEKGGGADFSATIKEMLKMAEKAGGGDQDRMYYAIQQLFGINTEGAATMMSIYQANKEGVDIDKAVKDNSKKLAEAFDSKALEQSVFKTLMNKLIELTARIGMSLLDATITGFKVVGALLKYGFDWFITGLGKTQTADLNALLDESNRKIVRISSNLYDQVGQAGSLGKKFIETMDSNESAEYKKASERYYRDRTGEEKGESGLQKIKPFTQPLQAAADSIKDTYVDGIGQYTPPALAGKMLGFVASETYNAVLDIIDGMEISTDQGILKVSARNVAKTTKTEGPI